MRSIFAKLFIWFWLSTVFSGLVFFVIAFNLRLSPLRDERKRHFAAQHQQVLGQALTIYGGTAALLTERDGSPATADANRGRAPEPRPYLFAADGTPISRGVPSQLAAAVKDQASGKPERPRARDAVVVKVQGPSGKQYLAAAEATRPVLPPPHELNPLRPPPFSGCRWRSPSS